MYTPGQGGRSGRMDFKRKIEEEKKKRKKGELDGKIIS